MSCANIDAVLNQSPEGDEVLYDMQIDPVCGDILSADQLDTAILVSLFSDARAAAYEIVKPQLRRGWVGDLEKPEDPIGSKLWLLEQARLTSATVAQATNFSKTSLAWMTRDEIALSVAAQARVGETSLFMLITITKPHSRSETVLAALWDGTGA